MEVKVGCNLELDRRTSSELTFFGQRWKQALYEDCNIQRVCRFNGDTADTIDVINGYTFRTTALNSAHVDIVKECARDKDFRFNFCTVYAVAEQQCRLAKSIAWTKSTAASDA
ncbi:hypothetical protein PTSG_12586 [Salpingoeca rosetta]|uniref:Uncharacterized protein n=1 Tax=Salpingoeca rosetta (strain ATCC 50818 / BSB-021) TaxID=946362 RepID=F2UIR1_SALR5|nr:uncharacterized protein PTSG_12586 [Salpingoeca rosetta]EGD77110.1 hypothetical protein PTSG_12586 [Salpingoeca rosetta]|eukprot:XP_004990949.1 hypothetical protein PTSG_12586 [Salpingoeca rosetta]